jgi:hypothetical protein
MGLIPSQKALQYGNLPSSIVAKFDPLFEYTFLTHLSRGVDLDAWMGYTARRTNCSMAKAPPMKLGTAMNQSMRACAANREYCVGASTTLLQVPDRHALHLPLLAAHINSDQDMTTAYVMPHKNYVVLKSVPTAAIENFAGRLIACKTCSLYQHEGADPS